MLVELLGEDQKNYSSWITMNKFTYANMKSENRKLIFPEVEINYENLPKSLYMIEEFELNSAEIEKLNNANIFCVGNLSTYNYEDLRFELGLESDIARRIMTLVDSYLGELKSA